MSGWVVVSDYQSLHDANERWHACRRKRRYATEVEAEFERLIIEWKRHRKLQTYACRFCDGWHHCRVGGDR